MKKIIISIIAIAILFFSLNIALAEDPKELINNNGPFQAIWRAIHLLQNRVTHNEGNITDLQNRVAYLESLHGLTNNGEVTVSTYNNPNNGIVRAGSTGNIFGYIKFDALNEDLDLDQLKLYVADGAITGTATGNYQDVLTVYLYDGSTLLGSNAIPSTGNYTFNFPNSTLTIPEDSSKILTIKADIGNINPNINNTPGTPAADIKFGLGGTDGFKFTGNDSNQTASEIYNSSTSSSQVIHKAISTVTYSTVVNRLGAISYLRNGASDVFAFNISADANGNEVLLYQAGFGIVTGGSNDIMVSNCYLKDGNGNSVSTTTNPVSGQLSYLFDNPDFSAGDYKEALDIAPGTSETFTLNCTVSQAGTGDYLGVTLLNDNVSAFLPNELGHPEYIGLNTADGWENMSQGNFIWSDNYKNRGLATDGANATAWGQWYNSYLVPGMGSPTMYVIAWSS